MTRVFVGTAAWGIPREHAERFPGDGTQLERYARVLGATEINSTFYRRHRPTTFERWSDSVPADFRFAVKMPRSLTHEAGLVSPLPGLREFFADVRGLGAKLGPILVQLPASLAFDFHVADEFFRTLRSLHRGPVACEPRHRGWYGPEATDLFAEHGVARVVADPPRPKAATEPAGSSSLLYIRLHGSPEVYRTPYDDARLAAVAARIREAPAATVVWCVLDNTASGAAAGDALRLVDMLGDAAVL